MPNFAWMRLLQIVREPEGVTGVDPVKPPVKANGLDKDEDEDDDDEPAPDQSWEKYAKRVRNQAGKYRQERNDARQRASQTAADLEAAKQAAKTEADAIRTAAKSEQDAKLAEAVAAGDKRVIRTELRYQLKDAGCTDVEAGLQLVDASGIKITEAGDVEGATEAITKLKDSKAYLFGTKSSTTTSTARAPNPKSTDETVNVRTMKEDEVKALAAQRGYKLS